MKYKTKPKHHKDVYTIAIKMLDKGVNHGFVSRAVTLALEYEGGFELMQLWDEAEDHSTKDEIIADIQRETKGMV